jgi:ring-1,2-phenylacetyl-CoA epoxidase subunit PaaE
MSLVKSTLKIEKDSTFTLYYGNRTADSVIFKEELTQLLSTYSGRLKVNYVFSGKSQQGDFEGRISAEKCDEFAKANSDIYGADEYFLCGPEEMIFGVKEKLESNRIDKSKIHFELFNTPVKALDSKPEIPVLESEVTVMIDGEEHIFNLSSKGASILDAAMDAGADVPFSCKGAVCCTCRAKLVEGSALMALNYSLTDKEVNDGYILTCQAHPTSQKVLVDYDHD